MDDVITMWLVELTNTSTQNNALLELCKIKDKVPDLGVRLLKTRCVLASLLNEIMHSYKFISPPRLSLEYSMKLCQVLQLFQCVAYQAKPFFIKTNLIHYILPYFEVKSLQEPYSNLICASLELVNVAIQDENDVRVYLNTGLMTVCLFLIQKGNESMKSMATFIVYKILSTDYGLEFVCSTYERFRQVAMMLGKLIMSFGKSNNKFVIYNALRCYIRMTDNNRAREALRSSLPDVLRVKKWSSFTLNDSAIRDLIISLLKNLEKKNYSVIEPSEFRPIGDILPL